MPLTEKQFSPFSLHRGKEAFNSFLRDELPRPVFHILGTQNNTCDHKGHAGRPLIRT